MLRSMTAYSRMSCSTSFGRLTIEMQSLNRRHLEIQTNLPREWLAFDSLIKETISQKVQRGQINVMVNASFERKSPLSITPNLTLAHQIKAAWEKIAISLQIPFDSLSCLELLAKESGILHVEVLNQEDNSTKKALQETLQLCLAQLISMKEEEGKRLYSDIISRFESMQVSMKLIRAKAPQTIERYRIKLKERLEQVLAGCLENEEKILREVSVYADKVDITEEITRFDSHLSQALQLLQSATTSVGKTVEFLLQELNREVNTVASKAADAEIGAAVIAIKAELERVREQIQNVE